ncbi:MAG: hypothetical protein IKL89_04210 [Clostridia bacterium]|nr:hypothetical protein [Clostridia bacterium]
MEKKKGVGTWLEGLEQKNPLLFKTYYPACVMEFGFLSVILAFALIRLVSGGFDRLAQAIAWLEPLEIFICCLVHPLIITGLHYKNCRKIGQYVYFKSLGYVLPPCLGLTAAVCLNDILVTGLLTEQGFSFSWKMSLLLLVATVLVLFVMALVSQMVLIFARARNE